MLLVLCEWRSAGVWAGGTFVLAWCECALTRWFLSSAGEVCVCAQRQNSSLCPFSLFSAFLTFAPHQEIIQLTRVLFPLRLLFASDLQRPAFTSHRSQSAHMSTRKECYHSECLCDPMCAFCPSVCVIWLRESPPIITVDNGATFLTKNTNRQTIGTH